MTPTLYVGEEPTSTTRTTVFGSVPAPGIVQRMAGTIRTDFKVVALSTSIGTSAMTGTSETGLTLASASVETTSPGIVFSRDRCNSTTRTASQIAELREMTGLTWEQLARMFGVDRRSVHFWAQGTALNARNAENLARVFDVIRDLGIACRGRADDVRSVLLSIDENGIVLIDRLVERCGGERSSIPHARLRHVSKELAGKPIYRIGGTLTPADRLSASPDAVPTGNDRAGRKIRLKKGPKDS